MQSILLSQHANSGKDYLTILPSEIQQNIISHLLPTHDPEHPSKHERKTKDPANHSLDFLAATSTHMRNEVMCFARIWLIKNRDSCGFKNKTAKEAPKKARLERNYLRGPNGLINYVSKHCVYCGKTSTRSATMMNGLGCCKECDAKHWPDKITKTMAKTEYDLKDHQLTPHDLVAKRMGLPKLRQGTYMCQGALATMFIRSEVIALARLVHGPGDLEDYLKKRKEEREERERKKREHEEFIAAEREREKEASKVRLEAMQKLHPLVTAVDWKMSAYPFTPTSGYPEVKTATPASMSAVLDMYFTF